MYSPPSGTAAVPGTTISSTAYNNLESDIGNEITNSLPTTGVKAMGANLPMGGFKITGMADPSASTDGMTKNYADTNYAAVGFGSRFVGGTSTGSANAQILATTTPNTFTLTAGNSVVFKPGFTPTGPTTLQVGGTAATAILKRSPTGPVALVGGEFIANQETSVVYDGTQFLLNEASGNIVLTASLTDTGPLLLTGVISPAALAAGSTNNYAPAGLATANTLRLSGDPSGSSITGLGSQPAGTILTITNVGSGLITLLGNNAGSVAANRFLNTVGIWPAQSVAVQYDTTSTGWQILQAQTAPPPAVARKNLKIVTTSATAATITADELILEDPSGATYRATNVNVSYATGTSGANGLDSGSMTASSWYFEWVIYNAATNTLASLISGLSTTPVMPSGYTFKARVGASYFDAGSKLRFKIQYDRSVQYVIGTNPTNSLVVASGSLGSFSATSPTLATVSLTAYVPTTASKAYLIAYTAWKGGTGSDVHLAPSAAYGGSQNGVAGSNGNVYIAAVGGGSYVGNKIELILEAQSFAVTSNASGCAVASIGYEDNL